MSRFFKKYNIYILLVVAFLIRLIHLDQSLWLDEATTAVTVKTYSFWQIVTQFSPADFHPPVYYLFMDLWTNIFGYSEISLRIPSVILTVAAGWYVYKAAKLLFPATVAGSQAAWWSAGFFLFNPLLVYYSQEARMYAAVNFLVAFHFYYLVVFIRNKRILHKSLWYHLSFGLLFLTFYASIFYIAAVLLYLLYTKKYHLFLSSIAMFFAVCTLVFPLLYTQYTGSIAALESVKNWSLVLGTVTFKNLFLIPIKFTSGRISFEPKILYFALAGSWMLITGLMTMLAFGKFKKEKDPDGIKWMLLYFIGTPLLMGVIFSFISPLLQYFRFQYVIGFWSVLVGYGFYLVRPRLEEQKISFIPVVLLFGFTVWSLVYLLNPSFHREDWKTLSENVSRLGYPVYMVPSSADPMKYYIPSVPLFPLSSEIQEDATHERIVVVPYTADIHGIPYVRYLSNQDYVRKAQYSVRDLTYEVWEKN